MTSAQGRYSFNPSKTRTYQLDLAYDSIHNLLSKQQADVIAQPSGTPVTQQKTSYAWTYEYAPSGQTSVRPHAPIHIGERTFSYDANGNQLGWDHDHNGTRRNIVWDEENRIQSVFDNGHEKFYKYDDAGERVIKRGPQGETVYVNQFFTIRDRSVATKHVWAGSSRLASRLVPGAASGGPPSSGRANGHAANAANSAAATRAHPGQGAAHRSDRARGRGHAGSADKNFPGQGLAHRSATADLHAQNTVKNPHYAAGTTTGPAGERDNFLYYFHPDHLGSSNLVTDADGEIFEHLEYFPFGETWVEESSNTQRTPYKFTGKELDEETGLYYFGARYYDPRMSVWQSADAILGKYLPTGDKSHDKNLPGLGGVYNSFNLGLYTYGHQNPVKFLDPDGNETWFIGGAGVNGTYINDMASKLSAAGISNVRAATPQMASFGNQYFDAALVTKWNQNLGEGFYGRYQGKVNLNLPKGEQLNLIGYSHGAIAASQTALAIAEGGQRVDNVVLIGAPINQDLLDALKSNKNIGSVHTLNLTDKGDPIRAGMSDTDIIKSVPTLMKQQSEGTGHFYYAPDTKEGGG